MASMVPKVKLGSQGLLVSAQGLGCMGMSGNYGPPKPKPDMIKLIHHAIDSGVTFLDTSNIYGPHTNEILIGKMGELKKLVEEGKVKYVGLSEASAATIKRAHAVHPITAVQNEWSLWSRYLEDEIIPTCRELGTGIVPCSLVGRGFLASGLNLVDNLIEGDVRKSIPRFQNIAHNKTIFERVNEMATRKGCTAAQLALAWVHHQGTDVVPIPGTTKLENFNQNVGALSVKLTPEEMVELESFTSSDVVKGERNGHMHMTWINSDTPTLTSWKCN